MSVSLRLASESVVLKDGIFTRWCDPSGSLPMDGPPGLLYSVVLRASPLSGEIVYVQNTDVHPLFRSHYKPREEYISRLLQSTFYRYDNRISNLAGRMAAAGPEKPDTETASRRDRRALAIHRQQSRGRQVMTWRQ